MYLVCVRFSEMLSNCIKKNCRLRHDFLCGMVDKNINRNIYLYTVKLPNNSGKFEYFGR